MPSAAVGSASHDLVEREDDLERLSGLMRRAAAGAGQAVLVRGPAGAGKTSLLEEGRKRAIAAGARVLTARGGQLESDFAFGVTRQLFEAEVAAVPRDRRELLFAGAAALAGPVFGMAAAGQEPSRAESDFAVHHGLFWLTANAAAAGPLMLLVDDAHWSDAPSLRWIAYLARRLAGMPVLLALGVRTGEAGPAQAILGALAEEAGPEVIEPAPLSAGAVGVLVERRLGAPDDAFAAACRHATAGNPFLLSELLSSLAAEGVAPVSAEIARVEEARPEAIAAGVLRRVARLGPEAEALAKAVAILGTSVELRHAAALSGLAAQAALEAADRLGEASVLGRGRPLEFVHPILRRAIHESIPPGARATAHASAARMLAGEDARPDVVAGHLLRCEPQGDQWVVAVLRDAAQDAVERGAADIATALLERASREPPDAPARAPVLYALGRAQLQAGDRGDAMAAAIAHLGQARATAADAGLRARAALHQAVALWGAERTEEAVDVLIGEIRSLEGGERELVLRLEAHLVSTGWLTSRTSHRVAGRLGRFGTLAGHTRGERLAAGASAFEDLVRGAPAQSVAELAERAGAFVDAPDDLPPPPWPIAALTCVDRFERATALCDAAMDDARSRGAIRSLIILTGWRTAIGLRRGALLEAEADARHAFDLAAGRGFALDLPATRAFLTEALVEQGRLADAARVVEDAGRHDDIPPHVAWNWFRHARGRLRLASGDAAGALADQLACGEWMREWGGDSPAVLPWRSAAALAHLAQGERGAALDLAEREVATARRIGAARAIGRAQRVLGLARGGEAGLRALEEAVGVLAAARAGARAELELAHALVDLGAALRRAGQRRAARERLAAGMDAAHRCGAGALVERAREELLATGARPRREATTGRDSLTPGERRVAQRAAAGLTNREIAQELFVTPRTVEVHLTRIFGKLGIRSRTQLASALGAQDAGG